MLHDAGGGWSAGQPRSINWGVSCPRGKARAIVMTTVERRRSVSDVWKHCVEVLRRELTSQQFNTWILPLQAEEHGDRLYVLAPNRFVLDWVRGRFAPQLSLIHI